MPTDAAPRISVITPVYNAERFIGSCIRSVIDQTFTSWEQIVVDDGSTDATRAISEQVGDPRVRYMPLPHRGLAALAETYNTALAVARGELIAILEGDDEWPANKFELQVDAFDDPDVVLTWGRSLIIDDEGNVRRRWVAGPRVSQRDMPLSEVFRFMVRVNILSPTMTVMIRRSALEAVGGFQQTGSSMMVDVPTWLKVTALIDGKARFIPADLGRYRIHGSNTGLVHNSKMRLDHHAASMAALRSLGAERLARLGWSPKEEQRMRASLNLSRGVAHLQSQKRREARAAFISVLRETHSMRERVLAGLGWLSSASGLDMISQVHKLRRSAGSLSLRLQSTFGWSGGRRS